MERAFQNGAISLSRKQTSRPSLRMRLMMLVVSSVVPLAGFALVCRYLDYRAAVADAEQNTQELARSLSLAVRKNRKHELLSCRCRRFHGPCVTVISMVFGLTPRPS